MSLTFQVRLTGYRTQYFRHGENHRVDGPSSIYRVGHLYWKQYDKLHRTDGPAKIWGGTDIGYYLFDEYYTKEEYTMIQYGTRKGIR